MKKINDKEIDNLLKGAIRGTFKRVLEVYQEKLTDFEVHLIVRAFDRLRNHWLENKKNNETDDEINTIVDSILKKILRQFMEEADVSLAISKHNLAGFTK